jgi:hypothetical protein
MCAIRIFNEFADLFEFGGSRDGGKNQGNTAPELVFLLPSLLV